MSIAVIPLVSGIVSAIFAIAVLDQFFARRKPYQLIWSIGLFMYSISTMTEFWTGAWGLNQSVYRLWYLFGAILVAAYLGMGTLYLLVRPRVSHTIMIVLLIVSVYAAFRVFSASLDLSTLTQLSGSAMEPGVRLMSRAFSIFGTIALIGGAVYSAWVFRRHRLMPHRVTSNILIAVGVMLPAIGGVSLRAAESLTAFYTLELAGIIIIFIGFLRSREIFGLYRIPLIHGFRKVLID